jgi:hypothetical protein
LYSTMPAHHKAALVTAHLRSIIIRVAALVVATLFLAPIGAQEIPRAVSEGQDQARAAALLAALQNDLPYVPGEMLVRSSPVPRPAARRRRCRHGAPRLHQAMPPGLATSFI